MLNFFTQGAIHNARLDIDSCNAISMIITQSDIYKWWPFRSFIMSKPVSVCKISGETISQWYSMRLILRKERGLFG